MRKDSQLSESDNEDMTPGIDLPPRVAELLTEYGYRERALGIAKCIDVSEGSESYMGSPTKKRDKAAREIAALVSVLAGYDDSQPVERPRGRSDFELPGEVNKTMNTALRAYSTGAGMPRAKEAMRSAMASELAHQEQKIERLRDASKVLHGNVEMLTAELARVTKWEPIEND